MNVEYAKYTKNDCQADQIKEPILSNKKWRSKFVLPNLDDANRNPDVDEAKLNKWRNHHHHGRFSSLPHLCNEGAAAAVDGPRLHQMLVLPRPCRKLVVDVETVLTVKQSRRIGLSV